VTRRFSSTPLSDSLSDYYYTPMRTILVGSLCVLGVFLVAYDTGVRVDRWITNVDGERPPSTGPAAASCSALWFSPA
jgi:hypothetical protein